MSFASVQKLWDEPKYEAVESISAGCLGQLTLGRAEGLRNASRAVTLRALPAAAEQQLAKAVDVATSIGHPRLITTLGLARLESEVYLASEYIEGIPLQELTALFEAAEASLTADVAVRLTLEALRIVTGVRKELERSGEQYGGRCLYPDTVWISSAAELMLAEVPLAATLARLLPPAPRDWSAPEEREGRSDERSDVFAAGAMLYELLSGRAGQLTANAVPDRAGGAPFAKPLMDIITRATKSDPAQRFANAQAMTEALLALPEHCIATSADVRIAVAPLTRSAVNLDAALFPESGEHVIDPWEMPTRSLRQRH